jgi:hypothetical protein
MMNSYCLLHGKVTAHNSICQICFEISPHRSQSTPENSKDVNRTPTIRILEDAFPNMTGPKHYSFYHFFIFIPRGFNGLGRVRFGSGHIILLLFFIRLD